MTGPISLNEKNPHYFDYKGKPILLVTSAEHYGVVLNGAFDFFEYLAELNSCNNNLTRVFTGIQREFPGSFYDSYNTLAPKPKDFLCPYKRSEVAGANDAQKKFNLNLWDENFFNRLDSFMKEASRLDIIVEFTFFCPFYREALGNSTWNLSPYHPDNNINGIGSAGLDALFTWEDKDYIIIETDLIKKLVTALNQYDNLMFEIMNEPYFGHISDKFESAVSNLIVETEKVLPKKHLITQNIANGACKIEKPDSSVSVFNFHYASPPDAIQMNYGLNKPVGCNETGFRPNNEDEIFRIQAWEFMLAGGALFNNLDFSFAVGNESGRGKSLCPHTGGSHALRIQFGFLRRFLEEMDFISMLPSNDLNLSAETENKKGYLLAEPGKQYAFYSKHDPKEICFIIEEGEYHFEIFDPINCSLINEWNSVHNGGIWTLPLKSLEQINTGELAIRAVKIC